MVNQTKSPAELRNNNPTMVSAGYSLCVQSQVDIYFFLPRNARHWNLNKPLLCPTMHRHCIRLATHSKQGAAETARAREWSGICMYSFLGVLIYLQRPAYSSRATALLIELYTTGFQPLTTTAPPAGS